jgi:hypothetical protein
MLGIGNEPTAATLVIAGVMRECASDYGLRLGVNQSFVAFGPGSGGEMRPQRLNDGSPRRIAYKAAGFDTTRGYAQAQAARLGRPLAALQVELSSALRVAPGDDRRYFPALAPKRRAAYAGYSFLRAALEAEAEISQEFTQIVHSK